jgi:hypothetical protein
MEINPRLSASVEVAVRAGVDFPLLLYTWAAGDSLHAIPSYRIGLRMRWLGGDLRWLRETLRTQGRPDVEPAGKAFVHFVGDFFRPTWYDYLTVNDLQPAIVASAAFMRRIVGNARAWIAEPRRGREGV